MSLFSIQFSGISAAWTANQQLPPAIIFSDSAIRDQATGKADFGRRFSTLQSILHPIHLASILCHGICYKHQGKIESLPVTMTIENPSGEVISTATGHVSAASQVGPERRC